MHGYFKLCNAVYWLALVVWISVHITAAIAAMNVFGTLDHIDLSLAEYADYQPTPEGDVNPHGRLAAGMVMEGVFFLINVIQFVVIPLAVVMLVLQFTLFKQSLHRPANLIRTICIVGAAGLFAYHGLVQAPRMNAELRAYWDDAKAGDEEAATAHQAAFELDHPTATTILNINLILLIITVGASAAALGPAPTPRGDSIDALPPLSP